MRRAFLLLPIVALAVLVLPGPMFVRAQSARTPTKAKPAPRPASKPSAVVRAPEPLVEAAVPFRVGEALTYDVSWSSFLTAGSATMTVVDKSTVSGSTTYHVVGEGRPVALVARLYTLNYKAETWLDVYSLLPLRSSIYSEEGKRRRTKTLTFDQRAHTARFEVSGAEPQQLKVPPLSQDAVSAIYALRAQPLAPGKKISLPVADNGDLLTVQVTVDGRETVTCGLGAIPSFKLTPTILDASGKPETARALTLWISDDERKLPVRMRAQLAVGTFDLTLRQLR